MIVTLPGLFSYLFCSAVRSGAVVPVLVLLFVAFWFVLRGGLFCVLHCVVLFLYFFFGPFGVAIASLVSVCVCVGGGGGGGEGGRDGVWSWCFSCVCSVCACLGLSVSSSSWCLGRAAVCDCGTPWTFL